MNIRHMEPADIDAIVSIITDHEAWDEPYARAYFEEYFDRLSEEGHGPERNYVAVVDDVPVGVCGFAPPKFPSEDVLWGTWFYVRKDQRKKGVGASLITQALEAVRNEGARKIYLETSSSELYATAVNFYHSIGFELEGTLKDFYEEGEDLLIMGITLEQT